MSNASTPIDEFHKATLAQYAPNARPLIEAIYARVRDVLTRGEYLSFHETAGNLVRSVAEGLGYELDAAGIEVLKNTYAYRLFDWGRRQQTLEWVAQWARQTGRTFRIYGRGWEAHPTLSPFAAGVLEHGEQLRCANRASTIGLQLIPSGFRHQRSYELLVCGALPLTRYCETDFGGWSMAEFARRRAAGEEIRCSASIFPGLDRIVFSSAEEFAALADRYLGDEEYRADVRRELADVVTRDYTYAAVIERVTAAFRAHLARAATTQLTPVG